MSLFFVTHDKYHWVVIIYHRYYYQIIEQHSEIYIVSLIYLLNPKSFYR